MKKRKTIITKGRFIMIRTTDSEHTYIKMAAVERGVSISTLMIEAARKYLEDLHTSF